MKKEQKILNKYFIRFSKYIKSVWLSWIGFMILFLLDLITYNSMYYVFVEFAYIFSVVLLGYYILVLMINYKKFEKQLE